MDAEAVERKVSHNNFKPTRDIQREMKGIPSLRGVGGGGKVKHVKVLYS